MAEKPIWNLLVPVAGKLKGKDAAIVRDAAYKLRLFHEANEELREKLREVRRVAA